MFDSQLILHVPSHSIAALHRLSLSGFDVKAASLLVQEPEPVKVKTDSRNNLQQRTALALIEGQSVVFGKPRLNSEVVHYAVAPPDIPWGTHAYIISADLAERLAKILEWMIQRALIERADKSTWELDGDDLNSDHFIRNYYNFLTPIKERKRWVCHDYPDCMLLSEVQCPVVCGGLAPLRVGLARTCVSAHKMQR